MFSSLITRGYLCSRSFSYLTEVLSFTKIACHLFQIQPTIPTLHISKHINDLALWLSSPFFCHLFGKMLFKKQSPVLGVLAWTFVQSNCASFSVGYRGDVVPFHVRTLQVGGRVWDTCGHVTLNTQLQYLS